MNKHWMRLIALLLTLLMAVVPALGEMDEWTEMDEIAEIAEIAEPGEADAADGMDASGDDLLESSTDDVQEISDLLLSSDESESPDGETPVPRPGDVSGNENGATFAFQETLEVNGETWENLDLTRAEGFSGKLATISGRLTLRNVTIEGQSADQVNLLDYFDLNRKASIVAGNGAQLTLSANALNINRASSKTLVASWGGKALKGSKVKWSSSNKKLVTVNKNGRISTKKKGTASITARYKGQQAVCRLDITGIFYAESVRLSKKKMTLSLHRTAKLSATIKPSNTTNKTITWSSSNPRAVTVDSNGKLLAVGKGSATIRATTSNGKKASCKVKVKVIYPKKVDFRKLYVTMRPGRQYQTRINVRPSKTSYPKMKYTSSHPEVATVDENGQITALSVGTTTITAVSSVRPKVKNTCKVCVIAEDAPRLAGLVIGINPGHQIKTVKKHYPLAPGSHHTAKGVKTGASGRYTHQHEYEVVLQIGLKLKRKLEAAGAKVVITRTKNDVMLTNIQRAQKLNAAHVDVALQLHCNSCTNHSKTGSSGYVRTTGKWVDESIQLSGKICYHMSKATGFKNRGIKICNEYMSLNWTTTPSVLLEMGYLSNASDDRKLAKDSFREKLATGIFNGLCAYFGR